MNKKFKILAILLVVAAALIIALTLKTKPVKNVGEKSAVKKEKVDMEKLRQDYKAKIKDIFAEYLSLAEAENSTVEELEAVKSKLMALTVPPELRDLHVDLLFAIVKRQDFMASGNETDEAESQKRSDKIKADYNWIN